MNNATETGNNRHGGYITPYEKVAYKSVHNYIITHHMGLALPNIELNEKLSNRYFELDMLVVIKSGIYVVELKHWSGHIIIKPDTWTQNGSVYRKDPHIANNFKAKLLKGIYEQHFPHFPHVYIESVVVLTNEEAIVEVANTPNTNKHNPTFDNIDRFLKYLRCQESIKGEILSKSKCEQFAEYIYQMNSVGRPRDFVFPGYETVERLYHSDDRAEIIAKRIDLRRRRPCRLRVFFPSPGDQIARERATATLNVVETIGEHPNILKVWAVPNENNYIVEGSDWSETGTLRDILSQEHSFELNRALNIAAGIARGLEAAHKECVFHRALSPNNILLVNNIPKLMNFDLSFQLEDNRVTVIPDPTKLKRSPYIAPEIYQKGTIPEATADLFSLGVIIYEMLVGKVPFGCSTDLSHSNGRLPDEKVNSLRSVAGIPDRIVELVSNLIRQSPSERIAYANKVLDDINAISEQRISTDTSTPNSHLEEGAVSGLYRISRFITDGAESQVYQAEGLHGKKAAIKIFNRDVLIKRVINELKYSTAVRHPHIVAVDNYNKWNDGRYYIAYEWLDGGSLRDDIDNHNRPGIDTFLRGAEQLLGALLMLHSNRQGGVNKSILHNDIKPENIIKRSEDQLVLIDFGAASEPHFGIYEGTEGYVAPDLCSGMDRDYSIGGDLYALSVTLHEWLFGIKPVHNRSITENPHGEYVRWLLKGCSHKTEDRYTSARQMLEALRRIRAGEALNGARFVDVDADVSPEGETRTHVPETEISAVEPTEMNPFVPYLNSLQSGSASNENALAESQALSPLFQFIHTPNPIADSIFDVLTGEEKGHVILTGHAGDGKSTIALEIFKRLRNIPSGQPLDRALEKIERLDSIFIIKDFSEWSPSERAQMMQEMLKIDGPRFLLISNTGTLLDAFKEHERQTGSDWACLESKLLGAMNSYTFRPLEFHGSHFKLINLAMLDNLHIARQIFEKMLTNERWLPCQTAPCREACPIYKNVTLIQDNSSLATSRIFLAYRRMYEYGTRLTLRQLTEHFAYLLTAGLDCAKDEIPGHDAKQNSHTSFLFFNRFFGDDGSSLDPRGAQLHAVQAAREQNYGMQHCPTWERRLWLRDQNNSFKLNAVTFTKDFEKLRRYGVGLKKVDDPSFSTDARRQVRRALYFLHDFHSRDEELRFLRAFLGSAMLPDFIDWQDPQTKRLDVQKEKSLHESIMHVLREHFTGIRLPENAPSEGHLYITLNQRSHGVRQSAQVVLARYPENEFRIVLKTTSLPTGGDRRDLVLEGPFQGATLPLPLPFLDYVMLRKRGEVGRSMQASFIDRLERLKGALIRQAPTRSDNDLMLVRLRVNHTFIRQRYCVRNGRLEVTNA